MLDPAQTRTSVPASQRLLAPWPAANHSSFVTQRCLNQSLAKHNRKPMQVVENKQQRSKSIASSCRVFGDYKVTSGPSRFAGWPLQIELAPGQTTTIRHSRITNCDSRIAIRTSRAAPLVRVGRA